MNRWGRRFGALLALVVGVLALGPAGTAAAHPLGNFTVNHYDGLRLYADRADLLAVVDYAEIPTLQQLPQLDADGDGAVGPPEAQRRADAECVSVAGAVTVAVDGSALSWTVAGATLTAAPGEAGLGTTRVECRLSAPAALTGPATVAITDGYLADRIGWREITATGDGVRLVSSSVPVATVSQELRSYPGDLLTDPLDVRSATLRVEPGTGGGGTASALPAVSAVDGALGELTSWFTGLVGRKDLTAEVGLLAVLLAAVLGASHALLPGHGKTVMAAYLAGRRGTRRDALLVGATVTATHTVGVLVLGLVLTLSTALAPDGVLAWLGVGSGLLVAGIGAGLLRSALRAQRRERRLRLRRVTELAAPAAAPESGAGSAGTDGGTGEGAGVGVLVADRVTAPPAPVHDVPVFEPAHDHGDDHAHDHGDDHAHDHSDDHAYGHSDDHAYGHSDDHDQNHGHGHGLFGHRHGHGHGHGLFGHGHGHGHGLFGHGHSHGLFGHGHGQERSGTDRFGRGALVGLGVAGGLVPSPTALLVLLGAIGLGRTWFGIGLVLSYGLGMAATLTAAGLLLVGLRDRLEHVRLPGRLHRHAHLLAAATPVLTALLVLIVGIGLATRSLTGAA